MLQEDTSNAIRMNSLDKYDKIYAKYSNAIEGRGKCDPPLFRDPPGHTSDPTEEVVHIKAGTNSVPYITPAPQREVTPPKVLLPDTTSLSIQGCILSRYHQDPPELKNPVASRDDDITPAKQSDKQCSRDEESVQSKLDRFNAKRMSLRSIYGSPSALTTASSKLSSGGDPPSDAIDSRLAFLTEQSMARRAIYATISPSTSKSDRDAKPKETHKWISATISFPHMIPSSSPSLPMKSLAMRLISEQMIDDYRMIQDKCSDCANYMLEAYDGSGIRKCVFCPINDFRAIIQGAVSNRVMAAKRIQGEQALLVSDGQCEHCYSPTHEGNSCEVCPILDEICIEVARAIGHGGTLSDSSCNDCGSQHVTSSSGEMQCLVCNVLHQKLGDQQIYKPGKTFASTSSIKSYQDTLDDTTQLLETIKLQDNTSVQIKLDEELVQAKKAQTLLETTIGNIAYEKKTSGIRTELKAELLKAKEAQLALQKMLESNNPPSTDTTQILDANSSDDASRVSHAITQREIVAGNVKEYIPPPKHFFQRGVPKTIWFEQRPRGEISVGTSHYTNDLKQSTMHNERRPVADCCGVRINKEPSYDDGSELFDDGSIGTDDEYTVDISLNSYNSKSAARNESRKHRGQRDIREKKTSKGRWRRWSIFDLCGRPPSFDDASEEQDTGHDDLYHTGYRPHHKYSFDNEELYHRALRAKIRRDDDSSHASMYSNITPPGILRRARYRDRSQSASFSVMTDDRSRMSHRRRERRSPSPGNSASSSENRKVSFYKNHHRDLDIDKLKTLTEEGDDSFRSDHPNHAVSRVRRSIAEYKSLSHEMNGKSLSHEMNEVSGLY